MLKFLTHLFRRNATAAAGPAQRPPATTHVDEDEADSANLVVMRRAVLNRDKKVVGYEFVQADASKAGQVDQNSDRSFLKHLAFATTGAVLGKRRAIVTVPARLLFDPLLEQLAGAGVAVMVRFDADTQDFEKLAERMQAMHKRGMLLGLSDARIALVHPELVNGVRLAFLPVDQIVAPDLLQTIRLFRTQHPQIQLLASGVHSYEEFEVCRKLRMHAFTGPFVTHRRDWQDRPIDPGTLRLCKLVNSLRAGAEMEAIIEEVKLDPLLSYRILCYANSAAIGAQNKILALKDAILLIGREPLFRWLVLLLCASAPSQSENSALLENALVRGRMMEMLAGDLSPALSEDFFLTGVLSLLDVILQVPASGLLEALDLPDDVKAALQERTGPYAGLLRLAEASEQTRAEAINDLCTELGIEAGKFSDAHHAALMWARGQQGGEADETEFSFTPPAAVAVPTEPGVATEHPTPEVAQSDDAVSQLALGLCYALGEGVPKDLTKAMEWYTKAAEQGNAKAQWNVAVMHAQGQGGVDRDARTAALWHQKAAMQGFAPAQAALGLMYASGVGVDKDAGKALALLQQAALQGDMEAQHNLAVMYEQGLAGEPDLEQALAWFSKAAQQGLPTAQERLGMMYAVGQAVQQDLVEAYQWFFIACKANQDTAKANLAHCRDLLDSDQVKEAETRAERWMHEHAAIHATSGRPE